MTESERPLVFTDRAMTESSAQRAANAATPDGPAALEAGTGDDDNPLGITDPFEAETEERVISFEKRQGVG